MLVFILSFHKDFPKFDQYILKNGALRNFIKFGQKSSCFGLCPFFREKTFWGLIKVITE